MKQISKVKSIVVDDVEFIVTIRTVFYSNLLSPNWGKNFFSAIFKKSGNSIGGSAMMQKNQFLSQLKIAVKHLN